MKYLWIIAAWRIQAKPFAKSVGNKPYMYSDWSPHTLI